MRLRSKKRTPRIAANHPKNVPITRYYRPATKASSVAKKLEYQSSKRPIKRFSISVFLNYLFVIIIFAMLFYATTMSSTPEIKLKKSDVKYHTSAEYQSSAKELYGRSIINRSKIFFRASSFEAEMKNRFPEISTIDAIVPVGGRNLVVSMSTSPPLLSVQNGTEHGTIDERGVYVSRAVPDSDTDILSLRFASPQENFVLGASAARGRRCPRFNEAEARGLGNLRRRTE